MSAGSAFYPSGRRRAIEGALPSLARRGGYGVICFNIPGYPDTVSNKEGITMANPVARFKTSLGDFSIEIFEDKSPLTAANFVQYIGSGFYDGTIFHRVIPGFMIQGGGMTPGMKEKDTKAPVKNEADNGIINDRGTIAMARTSDPHSATCQFFINLVDNKGLNYRSKDTSGWGYCAFGKVTEGMDVVDAIAKVATGNRLPHQNVPTEDVLIQSVSLI